jgi:hypothetical protein
MWCNQIFSLIKDEVVQNIIVCDNYEVANQIARVQYGEDAIAVDTTQYPLSIGCKYIDNIFYEEDGETVVERNLTADEEAAIAKAKAEALESQVAALNIAFAEVLGV